MPIRLITLLAAAVACSLVSESAVAAEPSDRRILGEDKGTVAIVREGRLEVTEGGRTRDAEPGETVVDAPGDDLTYRATEDTTLDVIQLAGGAASP